MALHITVVFHDTVCKATCDLGIVGLFEESLLSPPSRVIRSLLVIS